MCTIITLSINSYHRKINHIIFKLYLLSLLYKIIYKKLTNILFLPFLSCCKAPYPHVTITIHIRRKTLFYFNNLIVPCFLITALGLLTFLLPPATGERVTLVITTLLAMTVFMLMIAEKTPTTSKVTPLIGKFFIASMVIIGLSLIATCFVLNLYECSRSPDTVPKPIKVLVLDYLAPFLRVDHPRERVAGTRNNNNNDIVFKQQTKPTIIKQTKMQANKFVTQIYRSAQNGNIKKNQEWNFHNSHEMYNNIGNNIELSASNEIRQRHIPTLPREISEGISILSDRARQQDKMESLAEEWQAVAKVADRLFLVVFLITIVSTTLYIFVSRPEAPSD